MKTFFVRHSGYLGVENKMLEEMYKDRVIGIHYPWDKHNKDRKDRDSESEDPNDYEGGARGAMRTLVELARDGGYVCAQYRDHESLLLGKVRPDSRIELRRGIWSKMHPDQEGKVAIMKTLQLDDVKEVKERDYQTILVGRERQMTICRWQIVGELIKELVQGESSRPSLRRLIPSQQETMCSEFMRSPHSGLPTLVHLLLPVGRTMKDVDIYGFATDGRRIFGQVTYSEFQRASPKFKRLCDHGQEGHHVFFCKARHQEVLDGVTVFPIEDVFREFTETGTGKEWLSFGLS
jgi:hypothetical protein